MYEIMYHDENLTTEIATSLDDATAKIAAKHGRHRSEVGLDDRSSSMRTVEEWHAWIAGSGDHADPVATITLR